MTRVTRPAPSPITSPGHSPLAADEIARAEQLAQRLRGELLAVLARIERRGSSALALSRDLSIDRNISQRILAGVESSITALESLRRLPGPDGLRIFAEAAAKEIGGPVRRSPLMSAVEQYRELIRHLGGSQTKLFRRIQATEHMHVAGAASKGEMDNIPARRRAREAMTEMLGSDVASMLYCSVVRPIPESTNLVEGLKAFGYIGLRTFGNPHTLMTVGQAHEGKARDVASYVKFQPLCGEADGPGLIEEFCSSPLPIGASEDSDGSARTVLELRPEATDLAYDVIHGHRFGPLPHPLSMADRSWYQMLSVRKPCARLIFDTYLHRSLAAQCVPSIAAYSWHPALTGNPSKHWRERLPGRLTIEVLGSGTRNVVTDAWPPHQKLYNRLFELAGWNADDFIGYRCDVHEPIWSAVYYMAFDFSGSPMLAQPN